MIFTYFNRIYLSFVYDFTAIVDVCFCILVLSVLIMYTNEPKTLPSFRNDLLYYAVESVPYVIYLYTYNVHI